MDKLFATYQRELVILRQLCLEYARRYPKVAAMLQLGGEACDDPHVERLIQAVALLSARVTKRLDDSYPQFTEALLNLLFPHYLRPFPSCAIVQFFGKPGTEGGASATFAKVPRGTLLQTAPIGGVPCTFKTAYNVEPSAVVMADASFNAMICAPAATRLPPGATSSLTLVLESSTPGAPLSASPAAPVRLYIDADPSLCATLRDLLFMRVTCAYLQIDDNAPWERLPTVPIKPVGFADDEALIPFSARSHVAHRILAEYFAFPDKFNFFDIDIPALLAREPTDLSRITLHLAISDVHPGSDQARMLASLSAENLRQGCTPVVNLFSRPGVPITYDQRSADYTVLADASSPQAFEVYSVDKVHMVSQGGKGGVIKEFRPFYSLRHGEDGGPREGRYWLMRHDDTLAICSPGHEKSITLVDADCETLEAGRNTLSLELTCTNRELPCSIRIGAPEGDLFVPGAAGGDVIRFRRRPTRPARLVNGPDTQWRLISHLTLNHHSLVQEGAQGLREMLTLYDLVQSPVTRRQISGIVAVEPAETTAWMRHKRGTSLVYGIEVRLTLDEEAFAGAGLHLFAQVLDQFLGLYVHLNSFVELVILSHQSGKELFRCQPRSGSMSLL
jgi:type VI secretion system protein ImpG